MLRTIGIFALIPIVSVLACAPVDSSPGSNETRPNVVFILVDDLGWKDLDCYGSEFYDTPNVDALARQGVRFTNAYSAHPVCSPSRAAIMTGKDPIRTGITDWIPGMPPERAKEPRLDPPENRKNLPLDEFTLAEALEKAGYQTFFAGKWHLGMDPDHWPRQFGFDVNKAGNHRGSPHSYYAPYNLPNLEDGPEGEYLTDRLVDESIAFLEGREGDKPFFLSLWFYNVHTPIHDAKGYAERYRRKKSALPNGGKLQTRPEGNARTRLNQSNPRYASMVRAMDENVGRLLDRLEELDLAENTYVILTSDNGGLTTLPPRRNPAPTAVTPLRAGKGWAYEGGIRVPLIVRGPGVPRGETSRQTVTGMDFYPTILRLLDLPLKPDQHRDGKNIVPYIKNPDRTDERTLVWHYPHYHGSAWRPGSAIRKGQWKLIDFYERDGVELYDLERDIGEQNDLSDKRPELAEKLRKRLHNYIRKRDGRYPEKLKRTD